MGIYVFAVFLNFWVNLFLILGTNQIAGEHSHIKRTSFAAGTGGMYAAVSLAYPVAGGILWRLCCILLMGRIAFGCWLGRRGLLLLLMQLAVSGVAAGLHSSGITSMAITVAGVCLVLASGLWERRTKLVSVELSYGGRTLRLAALRDTGNTLCDPVTGRPVLVLGADVAEKLLGLTPFQLRHPVKTMEAQSISGLRLIPYHTVDTPQGLLLGLWIKEAKVGKEKGGVMVAFAPEKLSENGEFQALTGGSV